MMDIQQHHERPKPSPGRVLTGTTATLLQDLHCRIWAGPVLKTGPSGVCNLPGSKLKIRTFGGNPLDYLGVQPPLCILFLFVNVGGIRQCQLNWWFFLSWQQFRSLRSGGLSLFGQAGVALTQFTSVLKPQAGRRDSGDHGSLRGA